MSIMRHGAFRQLAAATSALCAAAAIAVAIPASAASDAVLIGARGNMGYTCTPNVNHGVIAGNEPYYQADNGCNYRVWLHEFSNWSGWSFCINPHTDEALPSWALAPQNAYVSSNTAHC